MTMKNSLGKCSLFVLSANGWKDQDMASSFSPRPPPQKKRNMEKALFDWPIVSQYMYDVKAKYRLISTNFSDIHPSVRLTNQKPHAFVSVL